MTSGDFLNISSSVCQCVYVCVCGCVGVWVCVCVWSTCVNDHTPTFSHEISLSLPKGKTKRNGNEREGQRDRKRERRKERKKERQ